ncbi:hypothetical protein NVP1117O_82, partial [Vibrio phage 1.117.O._10N.261.45.E9]
MGRKTFDFISRKATTPRSSWTNREIVNFHYFNMNGAYQQKLEMNALIADLVSQGKIKSGWIIAHGSMDDFAT